VKWCGVWIVLVVGMCSGSELVVPVIDQPPTMADFAGMKPVGETARAMTEIAGFTQREPFDGRASSQDTRVYLGHDGRVLYVVFLAYDEEPDKVRARLSPREDINDDDTVNILIDSFHDSRRGYVFRCNPLGVQWDGIWSERAAFDVSFNAVWGSQGELTDEGFIVIMAIPFKAMRFPKGVPQVWGVMFNRDIARLNEETYWPRYSSRIQGRLNQAGEMTIEADLSAGKNYQIIPYGTARSFSLIDQEAATEIDEDFEGDIGVDGKLVINDNLVLDIAINPDFSQVESDEPQITTNERFEVFFPERRPFFLENGDIFGSPTNLVFTRRIADPSAGLRLTGKAGPFGIGAFVIDDEAPGKSVPDDDPAAGEAALNGVFRLTRDLGRQSKLGVLYTGREFEGDWNHVYSADARILVNENWNANAQVIGSRTDLPGSEETLAGHSSVLIFNRSGRNLNLHLHGVDTSADFRTRLGFLQRANQRPNLRNFHGSGGYTFWPETGKLLSWELSGSFNYGSDRETGLRLDRSAGAELEFEWAGRTEAGINIDVIEERVGPADYGVLDDNLNLEHGGLGVFFESAYFEQLEVNGMLGIGESPNRNPLPGAPPEIADQLIGQLGFELRPLPAFLVDLTYLYITLEDQMTGDTIFEDNILRTRLNWQLTRELSTRLIFQYDDLSADTAYTTLTSDENLNGDLLVTWLLNPWTALYVGYNSNWRNIELLEERGMVIRTDSLDRDADQIFLKFSYLL